MKRICFALTMMLLLLGAAFVVPVQASQSFDFWWPWIKRNLEAGVTNAVSPDGSITISNHNQTLYIEVNSAAVNSNMLFTLLGDTDFETNSLNDGVGIRYDRASNRFVPDPEALQLETGTTNFFLRENGYYLELEW